MIAEKKSKSTSFVLKYLLLYSKYYPLSLLLAFRRFRKLYAGQLGAYRPITPTDI